MFPKFTDNAKLLIHYTKIKTHLLFICKISGSGNPSEDELKEYERQKRYFLTNGKSVSLHEQSLEISRNFIVLCSIMEENGSSSPKDYSIIQFYGKLDYLNKQIEKEKNGR